MFNSKDRVVLGSLFLSTTLVVAASYSVAPRALDQRGDPASVGKTGVDNRAALSPTQRLWVGMEEAEKNGRYDDALACNHAIRAEGGDLYLVNYRAGRLHALKKDFSAAIEAYRRAASLAPRAPGPLNGLAACYIASGETESAVRTSQSVLAIDPMNSIANHRLAELHFQSRQYAAAEAYYLKLLALTPEDLDIAAQYAWCLFHQGRNDEARAVFVSILTAAPGHSAALQGWSTTTR